MPDFHFKGKTYYNPVEFALDRIGGTWKIPILWRLKNDQVLRYSELKKSIPHISDKMLASQLKELEEDGLICREVFAEVPPRTEYSISEKGKMAVPIIETIRNFGLDLMRMEGVESDFYLKNA